MNLLNSSFHHSLAGKDIGNEGADIIIRNLFQEIETAAERYTPQNEVWETDILSALRLCKGVERGSQSAQAFVLAIIQERWNDMSITFRKQYDFQFDVLVLRETGVQPSTMDNYTRAAKVFFVDGKKPLGQVEVTKYDQYNRPVKKDGEIQKELKAFDPSKVSITKLALAAPLAKQDKLTPQMWNMLADNEITVDAFKKVIYTPPVGEESDTTTDPSLRFTLEGNRIIAHEFGESIEIGELYFDMGDNELGRTAIRRLLMQLQIPHEEDVISRMIQNARDTQLIRTYGDKLIVPDQEQEQ